MIYICKGEEEREFLVKFRFGIGSFYVWWDLSKRITFVRIEQRNEE